MEAEERIKEMAESTKTFFFCSEAGLGESGGVGPMSILQVEENGTLSFLSAKVSYKNQEIAANNKVKLYFQGFPHADFLFLTGTATNGRIKNGLASNNNRTGGQNLFVINYLQKVNT
jgi:general stress protein 26